jgi:nucleoid-associated protein YgaU
MPAGKKWMAVALVLVIGVGSAFLFRKDASYSVSRQGGPDDFPFGEPVERRVAGDAPRTRSATTVATERESQAWLIPNAATAAISEAVPASEAEPTFERSLNPVGALLAPVGTMALDSEISKDEPPLGVLAIPVEDDVAAPIEHRIIDGDTLASLAAQYLGTSDRSSEIFDLNRDVLTRPDLLPIGGVLKIPRIASEAEKPAGEAFVPGTPVLDPPLPIVPIAPRAAEQPQQPAKQAE